MKCLILAAGYATRLYPLTENFPKPLLRVGDKTILDWLIDDIGDAADGYVVISNHRFREHFDEWAKGRPITVLDDGTTSNETRLGAVRDIQFAIDSLHLDEDLLVIAGDNVLEFSLRRFLDYARRKGTSCAMRYREESTERLRKCGVSVVDESDRILLMEEKPLTPRSNWATPPFYYYTASDARLIKRAIDEGCGTDAPGSLVAWMSSHSVMHAMLMPGRRFDIGSLESYERVQKEYRGITA